MSYARQLLDTYPGSLNADVLAAAIDALSDCAQACVADTEADLSEQNPAEMVTCIRLCLNCADVCAATMGVVTRQAEYDPNVTPAAAGGLHRHPQELRRRVRAPRFAHAALPGLRAGLPPLRASLPGAAELPEIAEHDIHASGPPNLASRCWSTICAADGSRQPICSARATMMPAGPRR